MHQNWRDYKEWEKEGLKLSTASDTACKLFDAAVSQYVGWYEEPIFGGFEKTLSDLVDADPQFVMGKAIGIGLDVGFNSARINKEYRQRVDQLVSLAKTSNITDREMCHVNAIELWANGHIYKAATTWEDITIEYPNDMLALKFAHDSYLAMGKFNEMRDSIARALPQWDPATPLYNYLHGMFAFGLEETNRYPEAAKHARIALELNPRDAWATHALAHVYEMTSRQERGIKMLIDTENEWKQEVMLAGHNYWHLALFYLDEGDHEAALTVFDKHIGMRSTVDASSILFRLELEGANVGDRWQELYRICKPHVNDHIVCLNDAHFAIAYQRSGNAETMNEFMTSMSEFIKSFPDYHTANVAKEVGYHICEAFIAYDAGDYSKVVDLLYPLRYKIIDIGGSHAQRDIFNLLLIHSALKSSLEKHHKLAKGLLIQRQEIRGKSSMTERLISRALACH